MVLDFKVYFLWDVGGSAAASVCLPRLTCLTFRLEFVVNVSVLKSHVISYKMLCGVRRTVLRALQGMNGPEGEGDNHVALVNTMEAWDLCHLVLSDAPVCCHSPGIPAA